MKKLLLTGVAALAVAAAAPASAEIEINLGGFAKGYGAFVDQDEQGTLSVRDFDLLRHTEIHAGGETTLDNGLTVGVHLEVETDGGDSNTVEESYVYMSGGWGRVNLGAEDGANYLLQVAAPSADSNVDGLRQFVQPFNYTALLGAATTTTLAGLNYTTLDPDITSAGQVNIDYENNASQYFDKITYLTPVVSGFQAGVSYTPDQNSGRDFGGSNLDDQAGSFYGDILEGAVRFEGEFSGVGFAAGAGYTRAGLEQDDATRDDRDQWNTGLDLDFAGFGFGVVYTEDNYGYDDDSNVSGFAIENEETLVVGVDYTTGNFKLGASYLSADNTFGVEDLDTNRYTGGVVYTYGPGMTFRGSVQYVEHEADGTALTTDVDGTAVLVGTQINF